MVDSGSGSKQFGVNRADNGNHARPHLTCSRVCREAFLAPLRSLWGGSAAINSSTAPRPPVLTSCGCCRRRCGMGKQPIHAHDAAATTAEGRQARRHAGLLAPTPPVQCLAAHYFDPLLPSRGGACALSRCRPPVGPIQLYCAILRSSPRRGMQSQAQQASKTARSTAHDPIQPACTSERAAGRQQ